MIRSLKDLLEKRKLIVQCLQQINIRDLVYFKNAKSIWLVYLSAYDGDKSIYDDEQVLDNLYKIKDLKYLDDLQLYHLKLDDEAIENIKKIFPNARVVIE